MLNASQFVQLLRSDVVPALGCTEPVCVALCTSHAAALLPEPVEAIDVLVNAGIYKNGMSAGIPHCDKVGLPYAAALGSQLKRSEQGLEILSGITEETLFTAQMLISSGKVQVQVAPEESSLYVLCTLRSKNHTSTCLIQNSHTNVVRKTLNGTILLESAEESKTGSVSSVIEDLQSMTLKEIRTVVDEIPEEDLLFLLDGVAMNETLAAYSETQNVGVGLAAALRNSLSKNQLSDDLLSRILTKVCSAAESRLDGCPLPTMSSSGAGTKGLVVILPVNETADALGASRCQKVHALAFSHLVNRYINAYIGKLSPMCSCVMASSTAASAGMAYLMGASDEQIGFAVRNMCGSITGMICDGGKVGCALKVATGTSAAYLSAITAVQNAALRLSDGICDESPEQCIRNMAQIGIQGMRSVDQEIISIMEKKHTDI